MKLENDKPMKTLYLDNTILSTITIRRCELSSVLYDDFPKIMKIEITNSLWFKYDLLGVDKDNKNNTLDVGIYKLATVIYTDIKDTEIVNFVGEQSIAIGPNEVIR